MKYLMFGASTLALGLALSGGAFAHDDHDHDHDHGDVTAWRLFVSDHGQPVVKVIDAMDGDLIDSFAVKGPATLYRSDSGASVYAVQGAAGTVTAISSGISFEAHGDHADIDVDPPALTGVEFTGRTPAHFIDNAGHLAAFFDGEGLARVFSEHEALDGHSDMREVTAGAPHHGLVISFGQYDLTSVADAADPSRRIGLQVLDRDGNPVGKMVDCVGLHGAAVSGNLVVIGGCADGVLAAAAGENGPDITALPFPDDLAGGRVSTLIGGRGLQYFIGNHRPDSIVLIDPADEAAFRSIALPARSVDFAADSLHPRFAWALTEDGQLHRIDVLAGKIDGAVRVTDPYSMDGPSGDARPRLAVAAGRVFVTDPLAGVIHQIDAETLQPGPGIAFDGQPFSIVAVGGSGVVHDHDHADDHGHSHDHDHDHDHDHSHGAIYQGYFEDAQVQPRTLADWQGDWQSVYPYLRDGALAPVMEHKAEDGDMSADEYHAYYDIGYQTDVDRIVIEDGRFTFYRGEQAVSGEYADDGFEILTYEKGNRGVRFIFQKTSGDADAPQFVQFSDHIIAPEKSGHFHLYWGDDRAALLSEVTHWPTYYPSGLTTDQIVSEMLAH